MKGGGKSEEAEVSEGGRSPGRLLRREGLGWDYKFQKGWRVMGGVGTLGTCQVRWSFQTSGAKESNRKAPPWGRAQTSDLAQPHSPSLTINGFSCSIFSCIWISRQAPLCTRIRPNPQLIPVPAVNHHNPGAFSNTDYSPSIQLADKISLHFVLSKWVFFKEIHPRSLQRWVCCFMPSFGAPALWTRPLPYIVSGTVFPHSLSLSFPLPCSLLSLPVTSLHLCPPRNPSLPPDPSGSSGFPCSPSSADVTLSWSL